MDFEFNEEQAMFRSVLEKLVADKIDPILNAYPEDKPLPKEACIEIRNLIKPLGVQAARVPVEYGGSGLGAVGFGIAAEVMPPAAFDLPLCIDVVATRIAYAGTEEQKNKFIPPLVRGEQFAASATSEPNVGSDPRGIETKAVLKGDRYVLNGTKLWCSIGTLVDILLVNAAVGTDLKGRSIITPFIVEIADSPVKARTLDLLGMRQAHLSEIALEDVEVPQDNIMQSAEGHAHRMLTQTWLSQRPAVGLLATGVAQKAYGAALSYAAQRKQFGKPIASFQLVQNMLVEMLTMIDASKLLCYRALTMVDRGLWCSKESSMAKSFACESALRVTSLAIEIHGSYGITTEFPVEKYYRDVRVLAFPDGTIEINKLIVGREITGIRAFS